MSFRPFGGFAGYRPAWIGPDLLAGVTLAAIAVPEQMATARLAGLPPRLGFYAFIAGSLAFACLGATRRLSVGADSTIAPIFAGALALMAVAGSGQYAVLAACLAILVGALVLGAGVARLGWIGNLLSIPVTTGFLAGVAVHILVSQAPAALGLAAPPGSLPEQVLALARAAGGARPGDVAIAVFVVVLIAAGHRLSPRLPAPLLAVGLATAAVSWFHLAGPGVAVLGAVEGGAFRLALPLAGPDQLAQLIPLALLVALVVIGQTAATARAFADSGRAPDIDGDLIGVGAGSLLAGLVGAFPVNVSPPRTGVTAESGGRSPLAGLFAAALAMAVLVWAGGLLGAVPKAALAGVLMFVAARLARVGTMADIARSSLAEGGLVLATAGAIVLLPIASGVAVGVTLSLLHGAWSNARARVTPMHRLPGSTVWWPPVPGRKIAGETAPGVVVLGFAAPLTFLNADAFSRDFLGGVAAGGGDARLVVLEAAGLIELDYTGAKALAAVVVACRASGAVFAVARLEALAAQAAFARFGLVTLIGEDHIFDTVAEAIEALQGRGDRASQA